MFASYLLFVDLRYSPKYFFRSYNLPLGQKPSKEKKQFSYFSKKKQLMFLLFSNMNTDNERWGVVLWHYLSTKVDPTYLLDTDRMKSLAP
jgi:hypothetical protein